MLYKRMDITTVEIPVDTNHITHQRSGDAHQIQTTYYNTSAVPVQLVSHTGGYKLVDVSVNTDSVRRLITSTLDTGLYIITSMTKYKEELKLEREEEIRQNRQGNRLDVLTAGISLLESSHHQEVVVIKSVSFVDLSSLKDGFIAPIDLDFTIHIFDQRYMDIAMIRDAVRGSRGENTELRLLYNGTDACPDQIYADILGNTIRLTKSSIVTEPYVEITQIDSSQVTPDMLITRVPVIKDHGLFHQDDNSKSTIAYIEERVDGEWSGKLRSAKKKYALLKDKYHEEKTTNKLKYKEQEAKLKGDLLKQKAKLESEARADKLYMEREQQLFKNKMHREEVNRSNRSADQKAMYEEKILNMKLGAAGIGLVAAGIGAWSKFK